MHSCSSRPFLPSLIPVNKRSRTRLRREKVKEQEERIKGGERWRARRGEIKKKLRVTLCPNASFCCRTRQPADYLSRRGRACISVKSRSLYERREKERRHRERKRERERAHNRMYLEQDNNTVARVRIALSEKKRTKLQTSSRAIRAGFGSHW